MGIETSGQGTGAGSGGVRCSDCGGLNSADAEWCGQCLRRFVAPAPPSPPPPPPPPPPATVTSLQSRRAAPGDSASAGPGVDDGNPPTLDEYLSGLSDPLFQPAGGAAFADDPLGLDPLGLEPVHPAGRDRPSGLDRTDSSDPAIEHAPEGREHIAPVVSLASRARPAPESVNGSAATWTCRLCETPNDLEADSCAACGSSFADTMRPPESPITGDPNQAALYSLFFPGAGHAYLGLWGSAIARGVLSAWVLLVTAVLLFGADGGSSKVFGVVFALVSSVLWLAAAHDAFREASNQPALALLRGRRYLYVTGAVVSLLFLMFLVGAATSA